MLQKKSDSGANLNLVDKHVGIRVRLRRKMLAMNQRQLGDALGLTFQQVQKYEKGTNRIGASRLQQISHILEVPVEFFFDGAPNASSTTNRSIHSLADVNDFISSSEGLRLIAAFTRIESVRLRRQIVGLVQEMASGRERDG
jgi:transcriptional regulator with XRE-family HTH domain